MLTQEAIKEELTRFPIFVISAIPFPARIGILYKEPSSDIEAFWTYVSSLELFVAHKLIREEAVETFRKYWNDALKKAAIWAVKSEDEAAWTFIPYLRTL